MPSRPATSAGATWSLSRVVVLAAAVRLAYVVAYPQMPLCADCEMYDEVGRNVAEGRGFTGGFGAETLYRPAYHDPKAPEIGIGPIYPAFLGGVYRTGGHRIDLVRIVQALAGALMLVPLFQLASATVGRSAARLTVWLAAFYPGFIIYSGVVLTEALATVLLVLAVWSTWVAWQSDRRWPWVASGVLAAIATLLRAEFASIFVVTGLLALWRAPARRTVLALALAAGTATAVMAPWSIRNYRIFHRFIPVSAHGGDTLWISVKGWSQWHFGDPELQDLVRGLDYIQESDVMHDAAVREVAAHPLRFAWTRLERFQDFWLTSHTSNVVGVASAMREYWIRGAFVPLVVKSLLAAVNMSLIALGIAGMVRTLWRARRPLENALLMAAPILCLSAVHLALFAAPRYQVPMMPFVLAFASTLLVDRFHSVAE